MNREPRKARMCPLCDTPLRVSNFDLVPSLLPTGTTKRDVPKSAQLWMCWFRCGVCFFLKPNGDFVCNYWMLSHYFTKELVKRNPSMSEEDASKYWKQHGYAPYIPRHKFVSEVLKWSKIIGPANPPKNPTGPRIKPTFEGQHTLFGRNK